MKEIYRSLRRKFNAKDDLAEILKGSSISFVMKIIGLGAGQIFALAVGRLYGADVWGQFSLSLGILTIASIIGNLGVDVGLLKIIASKTDISEKGQAYKKSLIITFLSSSSAALIVYSFSDYISTIIFSDTGLVQHVRYFSFGIIPLSLIKLNSQLLRGLKAIGQYVFISFVARHITSLVMLVFLIVMYNGDYIVTLSYLISLYIVLIYSFFIVYRHNLAIRLDSTSQKEMNYKYIMSISTPLLLASSLVFIKGWLDTLMVGIFMPSSSVGIYNIALKLSTILTVILTAVNTIAAPKFAEEYSKKNLKNLQSVVQYSTKTVFYTTLPIFILFIIFARQILAIFGPEFTEGVLAFRLLCFGNLINALSGSVGYFLQMTGSQVAFQNIILITTIFGIILNILLIPLMGINGAALSTTAVLFSWNLTCVIYTKKKYNIKTFYDPFSK